jgi:hypothetical protein
MPALPDQLSGTRSTPPRSHRSGCPGGNTVNSLLRVSGGLGVASVLLGLSLLVLACAGFDAALYFSPAVITLGITTGVLTLISARRSPLIDDPSILTGLFLATLGLLGGLLELAVWQQWPILFGQHG